MLVNNFSQKHGTIKGTLEDNLSKELKKYYSRLGNRVIFSNGMTLNQFAEEMWERLGYKEIDPSVLSRVIKGERLFTTNQLETFATILHLSQNQKEKLLEISTRERYSRIGIDVELLQKHSREFIDLAKINTQKMLDMRENDLPKFALELADSTDFILNEAILQTNSNNYQDSLLETRINLLQQKAACLCVYLDTNCLSRMNIVCDELFEIAKRQKSDYAMKLGKLYLGVASYIDGYYHQAAMLLQEAAKYPFSAYERILNLRCLAISYAALKKSLEYIHIKKLLIENINNIDIYLEAFIYEGLTLSETMLGNNATAMNFLEKTKSANQKIQKASSKSKILRTIQMNRTEIKLLSQMNVESDKDYLKKLTTQTISLSSQYDYKSYIEEIELLFTD